MMPTDKNTQTINSDNISITITFLHIILSCPNHIITENVYKNGDLQMIIAFSISVTNHSWLSFKFSKRLLNNIIDNNYNRDI